VMRGALASMCAWSASAARAHLPELRRRGRTAAARLFLRRRRPPSSRRTERDRSPTCRTRVGFRMRRCVAVAGENSAVGNRTNEARAQRLLHGYSGFGRMIANSSPQMCSGPRRMISLPGD
jgi:hypothetical protein